MVRMYSAATTSAFVVSPPTGLSNEEIAFQWLQCAKVGSPLQTSASNMLEETYTVEVSRAGGLGLVLEELADIDGTRGLVLIEELVADSNAARLESICVGDSIIQVQGAGAPDVTAIDVEGKNWERTIDALTAVSEDSVLLTMKRLVQRATVKVSVTGIDKTDLGTFECPAGSNLRMEMLKRGLPTDQIYDMDTMRFDAIGNAGTNCGGEGSCGTCLISVTQGMDLVTPAGRIEEKVLKKQKRPVRWRWSCRARVGAGNRGGDVSIQLQPQKVFPDEQSKAVGL